MIIFRLCRSKYANDLSGKGAETSGGRWNSKGTPMLYTSASRALCLSELAVHLPLTFLPTDFKMVSIVLPDDFQIGEIKIESLPPDWQSFPHPSSTQVLGDLFIRKMEFLVLKVPSAVVPMEYNFLINPLHKSISKLKIENIADFKIDNRFKAK
jgi:RES domain-containing protein